MSFKSLLKTDVLLYEEIYITNDIGEQTPEYRDPITVKGRLNAVTVNRQPGGSNLDRGKISEDNRYTLYLAPETTITSAYKVGVRDQEFKVNRVRRIEDANGNVHHWECDLEELL